jgi:hypothetical protein
VQYIRSIRLIQAGKEREATHRQDGRKGSIDMVTNLDEVQRFGKDNVDATLKSFGAWSKSMQAIAIELADYSKRSFEQGTAATEKLIGAKSLDKAFEVQSDYMKSSYEGFVAQATRLGELCADLAKEAYKPFEGQFGKAISPK